MDYRKIHKAREIFAWLKENLLQSLATTEHLLITIDKKMFSDRNNLVTLLKYVGGGIDNRERMIKE